MPKIEHVVVLMLENRSFDCMLGRLYPKSDAFDGLDGTESNPWHRPDGKVEEIRVWNSPAMLPETAVIPDPDPGELFADVQMQLFGLCGGQQPTMSGFVDNYMRQPRLNGPPDPRAVMHYFTPAQVPVLSLLARSFGVSDRWHASAPCETWPNRYFTHCGTGGGFVNNERSRFPRRWPRMMPTIFNRLGKAGRSWKIYFHDLPQAATLLHLWLDIPTRFRLFEGEFAEDARSGRLPNYSFIEPRYYASRLTNKVPNDQHPPHNIVYGEQLIAAVYNALRSAPTWQRTLLIITYDEIGGCFDHVPPPPAVPPGGPYPDGFTFDLYGVRVPTVIVSPFVAPGSILRPPAAGDGPSYPFDHTSIIATLEKLFGLAPPMTPRVAAAPDLLSVLTLEEPANDGPERIAAHPRRPSAAETRAHARQRHNRLQRNLRSVRAGIPGRMARAIAHGHRLRTRISSQ
ncbi:MAG TPA: alkaline phosphatase family protein [Stellaceae bacterium]|nr:alkaline phosphatase family protein [Stellaceae bacterium]